MKRKREVNFILTYTSKSEPAVTAIGARVSTTNPHSVRYILNNIIQFELVII